MTSSVHEDAFGRLLDSLVLRYDPDHVVGKKDIDSFIAASSSQEFSRRLWVSTSLREWGVSVEAQIQTPNPPLTRIWLADLADAPIDWSQFSLESPDHMVRTDAKKSPVPTKERLCQRWGRGLRSRIGANSSWPAERGNLQGQTCTALQVVENQTPADATVLFLIPLISLLSQTLTEWKRDAAADFQAFAVCSDANVGKNTDADMSTADVLISATAYAAYIAAVRSEASR